jgi:hypothetical protein
LLLFQSATINRALFFFVPGWDYIQFEYKYLAGLGRALFIVHGGDYIQFEYKYLAGLEQQDL